MAKFKTIVTTVGAAKIAAVLAGTGSIVLDSKARMAVGDGNGTLPTPVPSQTALVHEVYRGALNSVSIDDSDPKNIVVELVIPPDKGGFWMREMALYDAAGTLLAVGNMAETYKPSLSEGAGRKSVIRMVIAVSEVSAVTITMDTSTVMATQDYVDTEIDKHAKSRNHPDATLTAKGFTQLNSATNSASETQAATPKAVKTVMDATSLKAPLASPALSGVPTAPTAPPGTNTQQLANTQFVLAAIASLINSAPGVLDTLGELAAALGNDANFATTMTNALAGKQPKDTTLTNLSGKDVAALLQYLGLNRFVQSGTNANLRMVLTDNDWYVYDYGKKVNIPTGIGMGGTGALNAQDARKNFGLKGAAVLDVGTGSGTVAAGDDSRIVNSLQKDKNLSELTDAFAARKSLNLDRFVQTGTNQELRFILTDTEWYFYDSVSKKNIPLAMNMGGSGAGTPADARKNFGLKGAAVLDVGTGAGTVAAGDDRRIVNAVQNTGGDINGQLRINANNNAIQLQATADNVSLFFRGVKKDGTSRWYIGSETGGDEATFYNYVFGTSLVLKASTVEINKEFYCKGTLRSSRPYPNVLLTDTTLGDDVLGKTFGIETHGGSAYLYRRKGDGSSNVGQTNLIFPDVNGTLISTGNLPTAEDVGALPAGGTAKAATKLDTARNIGGVSFDGTVNIDLPGVNKAGTQSTSGNAATATKLATPRTIAGKSFDGTANIAIDAGDVGAYTKGESDGKYQRQTRLGAESRYGSQDNYIAVPPGCVMTGLDVGGGASSETYIGYRPLQVNINGAWATINQL